MIADVLQAAAERKMAYNHYEAARASKEDQDFHSMETYIHPPTYDLDFDRIRLSRCEGTGTWLLQDTVFEQWLQDGEESPQVFWLQGIPGAGACFVRFISYSQVEYLPCTSNRKDIPGIEDC